MRRFRVLFVLLSVAVLLPMALLVVRALQSVALERRMRHQAVAERIFDEMERALSELVTREEARPFEEYSFSYASPEHPDTVVRSPLAEAPADPFVIGYFQIDPDESLHTPHQPRAGTRTGPGTDWHPSAEIRAAVAAIEQTVGHSWSGSGGAIPHVPALPEQAPGSTVELAKGNAPARAPSARPKEARSGGFSMYDALRQLNTGVEQRTVRGLGTAGELEGAAVAPALEAKDSQRRRGENVLGTDARRDAPAAAPAVPGSRDDGRVELTPMAGRRLDAQHLLLYRTVVHAAQGYRQGLLVEVPRLEAWLRQRALESTGLSAFATLSFLDPAAPDAHTPEAFVYQHRFAEPFDAIAARLELRPLPGVGDTAYMSMLAALLVGATVLGLAALYRMVAVVVRFAEQRSNFVAAVTHELKTPLTAIRMYGEMLRDGIVPSAEKRDEYHRHITAESERLTRLVNNVLELARLEKRTRPATLEAAPIGPLVQAVATMVRPHVEGAGLTLRVDVENDLPPVRFERDALTQVLFNLVDNAVKYASGATPPEIVLSCRREGDAVCVGVRDHGPGLPPRQLRRVFAPFYRGDTELTRRSKGTGLGLALVRGLADRMGARVAARNVPDGGFAVDVTFRRS